MRIAELARRAGIAASAVRWYEQVGVLPAPPRRSNGYRDYAESDLAHLRLVLALRRLGLGAEDAGRVARLCLEQGAVDPDLAPLLAQQREAIGRQRADLDRLEAELLDLEDTMTAAGRAQQHGTGSGPIRVLFVCTHNSARSQIAEALLRDFGGTRFEVGSAGTEPTAVHPLAVRVLAERGIDWSSATSKPVEPHFDDRFDYVLTVCDRARQRCPVFPGATNTLHWGLDDPSEVVGTDEERLEAFRLTRDDLAARLRPFIAIALHAAGGAPRAAIA